jgi:predicted peptidase
MKMIRPSLLQIRAPLMALALLIVSLIPGELPAQAMSVFRQPYREWKSQQGTSVRARLLAVNATHVKIGTKDFRTFVVPIASLAPEDQAIARAAFPADSGKVSDFEATPYNAVDQEFLARHRIRSLVWEKDGQRIPFLFYTPPNLEPDQKVPLIIHLHGTGGIGTDNLSPLFKDAQGIARNYFDNRLQGTSPCCIMIPQANTEAGWAWIDPVMPPPSVEWFTAAARAQMQAPGSRVDPKRMYLMGLSMGGQGVQFALARYPDFYAAGIAISYLESDRLFNRRNTREENLWLVINRHDSGNTPEYARQFARAYSEKGGKARVSIEDGRGHNAWGEFIASREFRTWLFRKRLQGW